MNLRKCISYLCFDRALVIIPGASCAAYVHKVSGQSATEADLNDFNPLLFDLQADPQFTVFYEVGDLTVMVLSEQRLEVLWKRHQINTQAQQNRK